MKYKLLDTLNLPEDIEGLSVTSLYDLSSEIREFLIEIISETGGHLASNLGIVELTIALHASLNSPEDKIIWDVGHQCYIHKLLTGRKDRLKSIRKIDGISGFPKSRESMHDIYNTGHSSTSISAGLGIARARDIKKETFNVVSVIGDGALTGGMAYEALNDAGNSNTKMIVILNDNEMSIDKNVGGMSEYLSRLRTGLLYRNTRDALSNLVVKIPFVGKRLKRLIRKAKNTIKYAVTPGMIFEELGFTYVGPIDGHNIIRLKTAISKCKKIDGPTLIHVVTQKGRGYKYAEKGPCKFHGVSKFDIETGIMDKDCNLNSYSKVFGKKMVALAGKNENIVAICAAMPSGTGLNEFKNKFNDRFFDVGIAEQHAVTLACGMAKIGIIPVVAIYSSFLQRAYDQILHDAAIQNLHIIFAIDRAGIVGRDGETHQGIYDTAFLSHIPNLTIMAPASYRELEQMLEYAINEVDGPCAIKYPRGDGLETIGNNDEIAYGGSQTIEKGNVITIVAVGRMVEKALEIAELLKEKGIYPTIINARFIKPIDKDMIKEIIKEKYLVIIEDGCILGGFGSYIINLINNSKIKTLNLGFPDEFIDQGSIEELFDKYNLTPEKMFKNIMEEFEL